MLDLKQTSDKIFFCVLVLFFSTLLVYNLYPFWGEQQYVYLAKSFLKGKMYFLEMPGRWFDATYYNGRYYWPLGPLPAVFLVPFVYFFNTFQISLNQGVFQLLFNILNFFLAFKISQKVGHSKNNSLYLAFAFIFASTYQFSAMIPWSWYFLQVITSTLLFLSIYFYLHGKKYVLIGFFMGLVFLSRATAGIAILFFILEIYTNNISWRQKLSSSLKLLFPFAVMVLIWSSYNYVRFGRWLDTGYSRVNNTILKEEDNFERIEYGLFSLKNVPSNFYYYFIKTIDPVLLDRENIFGPTYILQKPYFTLKRPGTSFFVVSPIFLYFFYRTSRKKIVRNSLFISFAILTILLLYFWPGWRQVGPRYTLDFLPLTFLALTYSFNRERLSKKIKFLIIISATINFLLSIMVIELI